MSKKIELLDCTLRDGAYITNSYFGAPAIKGIIKKIQQANIEIIECGWLKDDAHKVGTTFYHVPSDVEQYLVERTKHISYVAMIDWNRYDVNNLPSYDGLSINAIRVVFPHGKHKEGIAVGQKIKDKGYQVFFQAANTLAYSNEDLLNLADNINKKGAVALSIVDTFGAMFFDDLERIVKILDNKLDKTIKLGFHSHNNQQLSFALSMYFIELLKNSSRSIIVDSSLCGMGRGAGNATTELIANYLNKKCNGNYDMNAVMDAIDMYMQHFQEKYEWGYSIPYFIAGMYQCHVNNITYLLKNHRTTAADMRNIIASLSQTERYNYNYDLLEEKYIENQNRVVNDENAIKFLKKMFTERVILLLAPGKSIKLEEEKIKKYIKEKKPIVIGINAIDPIYKYDYLFFVNKSRYEYAKEVYAEEFLNTAKIVLSNIKVIADDKEYVLNFNHVIKRGWEHFDNAVICCLRFINKLQTAHVALAGFDGFKIKYDESYADSALPALNKNQKWDDLNEEIKDMFRDFKLSCSNMDIKFITDSFFDEK